MDLEKFGQAIPGMISGALNWILVNVVPALDNFIAQNSKGLAVLFLAYLGWRLVIKRGK